MKYTTIASLLLAGSGAAERIRARSYPTPDELGEHIKAIEPATSSCNLTATPECRDYLQIKAPMHAAFLKYGLTEPAQWAAVVALTVYESGPGYKYKHNVYPGRPGQGTSNMQNFPFNFEYSNSIPELVPAVTGLGIVDPASASDAAKDQLLALLKPDQYNFGSGQWYLTTKCPGMAECLATGTDEAFTAYMTECVGTEMDPEGERLRYWHEAQKAFGIAATYPTY